MVISSEDQDDIIIDEDVSWFRLRPTVPEDRTPEYILKTIDKRVLLNIFSFLLSPLQFENEQFYYLKGVCKRFKEIAVSIEFWSRMPIKLSNSRLNFCSFQWIGTKNEGTEGTCYRIKYLQTGEECALKRSTLFSDGNNEQGIAYYLVREIAALKSLNHPNIVELKWMHLHHGQLYMLFPYYQSSLAEVIKTKEKITSSHAINIMRQLLSALHYCHSRGILHRNLKPKHIVMEFADSSMSLENVHVKLADFALVRMTTFPLERLTNEVVSLWYRAPELILGERKYHASIDIWSLGCIFAEMISGVALFRGSSAIDQLFQIFQNLGTPVVKDWPELATLEEYGSRTFPAFLAKKWKSIIPTANSVDEKILHASVVCNPHKRLSAKGILDLIAGELILLEEKSFPKYSQYIFSRGNKKLDIVENQARFLLHKEMEFHQSYQDNSSGEEVNSLSLSYLHRKWTVEANKQMDDHDDADDEMSVDGKENQAVEKKRPKKSTSNTSTPVKTLPAKILDIDHKIKSMPQRFWAMEWIISVIHQLDLRLDGEFSQRTGIQAMILMDTYCRLKNLKDYWDPSPIIEPQESTDCLMDSVTSENLGVDLTLESPAPVVSSSSSSVPLTARSNKRAKFEAVVSTPIPTTETKPPILTPSTAGTAATESKKKLFYTNLITHEVNGYLRTEFLMIAMACLHLASKMEDVTVISLKKLFEYSHSLPSSVIEEVTEESNEENEGTERQPRRDRHKRKKRKRQIVPQHQIDRIDLFMIEEEVIKTVDYRLFIPTMKDFVGIFIEQEKRKLILHNAQQGSGDDKDTQRNKNDTFFSALQSEPAENVYYSFYRALIFLLYPMISEHHRGCPMSLFAILLTVGLENDSFYTKMLQVCPPNQSAETNSMNNNSPMIIASNDESTEAHKVPSNGQEQAEEVYCSTDTQVKRLDLLKHIQEKIYHHIVLPTSRSIASTSSSSTATALAKDVNELDDTLSGAGATVLFHSVEEYYATYDLTDEKIVELFESMEKSIEFVGNYKAYLEKYDYHYAPHCCGIIELITVFLRCFKKVSVSTDDALLLQVRGYFNFLGGMFSTADRAGGGSVFFRIGNGEI